VASSSTLPYASFTDRAGAAIVTGGSGAIGAATCVALAEAGADIALTYRGNEEAARRTANAVEALGQRAIVARVDLGDDTSVTSFVDDVVDQLGGVHTLVTAAAPIASQQFVSRITTERFRQQIDQDLLGFWTLVSAALPHLRDANGSIIAVTTVANRRYVLRDVLSTSPKAAVEALMKAIAAEEGRFGVRANAVGVGILDEGMAAALLDLGEVRDVDMDHALGRIPLGRHGAADDIARAVRFFASEESGYVTGQWLDVDGGYSI
jgi:3-oxoacyl-[acyl-carrier protein] reductase